MPQNEVTPEQIEGAAKAALRTVVSKVMATDRESNPVIDVTALEATETLAEWIDQANRSQGRHRHPYAALGSVLRGESGASNYRVGDSPQSVIDLERLESGAAVWTVVGQKIGDQDLLMLLGAARLPDGEYSLIRRVCTVRGMNIRFVEDGVWYDTRRSRTPAARTTQARRERRKRV